MRAAPHGLFLALALAGPGLAQELFVYPEQGQSSEQQEKDQFECYGWAKGQTGFDPMAPLTARTAPPAQEAPTASTGRGAVGGAALGAAVGKISGKGGGKGAAVGAVSGGVVGGMRRSNQQSRQQNERDRWAQEEAAQYQHARSQYNRAYAACLGGKGYTVR